VPAHKIAFNHTSSPSLRQRPTHGIICEIAYSPDKIPAPDAVLMLRTVDWLVDTKLVASARDIVETRILDIPLGYPVYTHARPAILKRIAAYLAQHDIHALGRFGRWEYINSDGCIWQAFNLARTLARPAAPSA
jgi:protoporphyrinogen oxidase